jgi:hypothetical protein
MSLSLQTPYVSGRIWGSFRIAQTFLSGSHGLYTVVLPFGGGIKSEVFDTIQKKLQVGLYFPDTTINLYVNLPSSYSYTQSIPAIADLNSFIDPTTNKSLTSLHWTLNELQNSVTIMCTDQSEIINLQNKTFWSGILVGIGSSLILNTVYDASKAQVEKAEKK